MEKNQVSGAEMVKLSEKLAQFSATLGDKERALFKQMFMLDRSRLTEKAVGQLAGDRVALNGFQVHNPVQQLESSFFQLMCW